MNYAAAHYALRRDRGKATEHRCPCGAQACDWAFDEPRGHSFDQSRYQALCRSCHLLLDAPERSACTRLGCDRPRYAKGICKLHYNRQRLGQTPRVGAPA